MAKNVSAASNTWARLVIGGSNCPAPNDRSNSPSLSRMTTSFAPINRNDRTRNWPCKTAAGSSVKCISGKDNSASPPCFSKRISSMCRRGTQSLSTITFTAPMASAPSGRVCDRLAFSRSSISTTAHSGRPIDFPVRAKAAKISPNTSAANISLPMIPVRWRRDLRRLAGVGETAVAGVAG